MKGLLLKEVYLIKENGRLFFFLALFFLALNIMGGADNLFLSFYPTMMIGLLPGGFLSYDEKCKWHIYCDVLPCSRRQVVTAKYLVSFLGIVGYSLLSMAFSMMGSAAGRGRPLSRNFSDNMMTCGAPAALFSVGVVLVFMFFLGAEKGRIVYLACVILVCALYVSLLGSTDHLHRIMSVRGLSAYVLAGSVVVFLLTWVLAMNLYKRREL